MVAGRGWVRCGAGWSNLAALTARGACTKLSNIGIFLTPRIMLSVPEAVDPLGIIKPPVEIVFTASRPTILTIAPKRTERALRACAGVGVWGRGVG